MVSRRIHHISGKANPRQKLPRFLQPVRIRFPVFQLEIAVPCLLIFQRLITVAVAAKPQPQNGRGKCLRPEELRKAAHIHGAGPDIEIPAFCRRCRQHLLYGGKPRSEVLLFPAADEQDGLARKRHKYRFQIPAVKKLLKTQPVASDTGVPFPDKFGKTGVIPLSG